MGVKYLQSTVYGGHAHFIPSLRHILGLNTMQVVALDYIEFPDTTTT